MLKLLIYGLLVACVALYGSHLVECGTEAELRSLINSTLNNTEYSSRVRPINDTGNPLQITVDLYLISINDVDEVEQKVTSTAYMKIVWKDAFMTWTPSDYGGITEITMPQNAIWKPDLALANAFDTITGLGDSFVQLTIDQYGNITWEPYQVFDSTCDLVMTYFPFDSQECDIRLVTWSSDINMTNIVAGSDGLNTAAYEKNANWDLKSTTTVDTSTSSTSALTFRLGLKRKPIFYLINFIIPIVLLTALNLLVFILPCDSGEKASFAIILFLSFAIFLLIVTEEMPEGMSTVPVMSMYLLLECIVSTAIVVVVIIELRFHNMAEDTPIPKWLQTFTFFIRAIQSKVFCCWNKGKKSDANETDIEETAVKNPDAADDRSDLVTKKTGKLTDGPVVSATPLPTSNSRTKLKDFFNQNKISPDVLFSKPEKLTTLYDNKAFQGHDLEDMDFSRDAKGANSPLSKGKSVSPSSSGHGMSVARRRSSVNSESASLDSNEDDDLEWSDVSSALDFFFFLLFAIINSLATFIAFVVSVSN